MGRKKSPVSEEKLKNSVENLENSTSDQEVEKDQGASTGEPEAEKDPEAPAGEPEAEKNSEMLLRETYRIVCCNLINETFGGVSFHNGVAYTDDSFTASWFRNKEGYIVKKE